jgi:hypothetical protein
MCVDNNLIIFLVIWNSLVEERFCKIGTHFMSGGQTAIEGTWKDGKMGFPPRYTKRINKRYNLQLKFKLFKLKLGLLQRKVEGLGLR